jgi:uncharacterized membrane protein
MTTRKIAFAAVIGAAYAALTMVLAPISFGPYQLRISEALCILPFFFPYSVWGLFIGCVISNLISAYGAPDVIFGALATLLAALCTMSAGKLGRGSTVSKILACLPPVVFNALIVGALITLAPGAVSKATWPMFLTYSLSIGLGEFAVMYALGLPALVFLPRTGFFKTLSALYAQK